MDSRRRAIRRKEGRFASVIDVAGMVILASQLIARTKFAGRAEARAVA